MQHLLWHCIYFFVGSGGTFQEMQICTWWLILFSMWLCHISIKCVLMKKFHYLRN